LFAENKLGNHAPAPIRQHFRPGRNTVLPGVEISGRSKHWRKFGGRTGRDFVVESTSNQREGGIVRKLTQAAINFLKKEDGPTAVEYAIMLALIVTICIGVITTFGSNGSVLSSNAPATVAIRGGN
jgi:pilus assembly protein Flp/PilA